MIDRFADGELRYERAGLTTISNDKYDFPMTSDDIQAAKSHLERVSDGCASCQIELGHLILCALKPLDVHPHPCGPNGPIPKSEIPNPHGWVMSPEIEGPGNRY